MTTTEIKIEPLTGLPACPHEKESLDFAKIVTEDILERLAYNGTKHIKLTPAEVMRVVAACYCAGAQRLGQP